MSVRDSTIELLTNWQPPSDQQDALRQAVLAFVLARPDACQRSCVPGHITASALVVADSGDEVLLTLHPRLGRWVQLGGHCEDTDSDITAAALREATEESGIDGLTVDAHLGAIHVHALTCSLGVPTRHLDLQFIARAPKDAEIAISDESLDLRWWPANGLPPGTDSALAHLVSVALTSPPSGHL